MKRFLLLALCALMLLPSALCEEAGLTDFSATFPDLFLEAGEEPFITDTLYQSQDIYIEITPYRAGNSDVYVADIYLRSVAPFQRAFGGGRWRSKMESVKNIAVANSALLALTGDNSHNFDAGWVIANGEVKRKTTNRKRDLCVLYKNGEMATYAAGNAANDTIRDNVDDIWQTFLFGPMLLDEGKVMTKFNSTLGSANPRAAIGYFEPGHYCLVQVDGRSTASQLEEGKKNAGMTLKELSQFFYDLGCKAAYNLDGGQSALLWYNGNVVSNPYKGGRVLGDIVMIKEVEAQ